MTILMALLGLLYTVLQWSIAVVFIGVLLFIIGYQIHDLTRYEREENHGPSRP